MRRPTYSEDPGYVLPGEGDHNEWVRQESSAVREDPEPPMSPSDVRYEILQAHSVVPLEER